MKTRDNINKTELKCADLLKDWRKKLIRVKFDLEGTRKNFHFLKKTMNSAKEEGSISLNDFAIILMHISRAHAISLSNSAAKIKEFHNKMLKDMRAPKNTKFKYSDREQRLLIYFESLALQVFMNDMTIENLCKKRKEKKSVKESVFKTLNEQLNTLVQSEMAAKKSFFKKSMTDEQILKTVFSFINFRVERYYFIQKTNKNKIMPTQAPFGNPNLGLSMSEPLGETVLTDYFISVLSIFEIGDIRREEEECILDYKYSRTQRCYDTNLFLLEETVLTKYCVEIFNNLVINWRVELLKQYNLDDA